MFKAIFIMKNVFPVFRTYHAYYKSNWFQRFHLGSARICYKKILTESAAVPAASWTADDLRPDLWSSVNNKKTALQ